MTKDTVRKDLRPRLVGVLSVVVTLLASLGLGAGATHAAAGDVQLQSGRLVSRAPMGNAVRTSFTVVTANIPFTLSNRDAKAEVLRVLSKRPDVVLMQEIHDRNLRRWVTKAPGNWGVVEPVKLYRQGSPIVYNADRFTATQEGEEIGYDGVAYDRWMNWATLKSGNSQLAVVSMHLPPRPTRSLEMQTYYRTMARSYKLLTLALQEARYPVILGADWNRPLDVPAEKWAPVRKLAKIGMTTNWLQGTPCQASTVYGGRIDGFGFDPTRMSIQEQGCWGLGLSDHRPVWMRVGPR